MAYLPDHLFAPPLHRWLASYCDDARVVVGEGTREPSTPRQIRAAVSQWPTADGAEAADFVIVAGGLDAALPAENLEVLGAVRLIDLSWPTPSGIARWLTRWKLREQVARSAVRRLERWRLAGLRDAEQWVTTDPTDVVVTLGRMR